MFFTQWLSEFFFYLFLNTFKSLELIIFKTSRAVVWKTAANTLWWTMIKCIHILISSYHKIVKSICIHFWWVYETSYVVGVLKLVGSIDHRINIKWLIGSSIGKSAKIIHKVHFSDFSFLGNYCFSQHKLSSIVFIEHNLIWFSSNS